MVFTKYFPVFILLILFSACGNCPDNVYVGFYELSDKSIEIRPYVEVDSLFFLDNNNEEQVLVAGKYSFDKNDQFIKLLCADQWARQREFVQLDRHGVSFFDDNKNISFITENRLLNLDELGNGDLIELDDITDDPTDPDSLKVYDALGISINGLRMDILLDNRDVDTIEITKSIDFISPTYFGDTAILGKYFIDVFGYTNDINKQSVFYTKELGVVSISWGDDQIWVLDDIQ